MDHRTPEHPSGAEADGVPPAGSEATELEIRTADGASLRATVREPAEGVSFVGTCVLAHALFARRTSFDHPKRAGLAQALAAVGFRTVAFDFRGHGESRAPAGTDEGGYDEFVASDLPSVVEGARARSERRPVVVVGHSLGGHAALASQGLGLLGADGVVAIAASVWIDAFEPSRLRSFAKRGALRAMSEVARRAGSFPARALRAGSDDASLRFVRDLARFGAKNTWTSRDGTLDYLAGLAQVRVPVCSIASVADRIICPPRAAEDFVRRCGGPVRVVVVDRADDGGPPPGHMELVTGKASLATVTREITALVRSLKT